MQLSDAAQWKARRARLRTARVPSSHAHTPCSVTTAHIMRTQHPEVSSRQVEIKTTSTIRKIWMWPGPHEGSRKRIPLWLAKDGQAVRRTEGQEKPESLWLEEQKGEEAAFMEQFVKQLLEELALGRLDICTADGGFRRKGEWMQQEKLPWLAPAVGMLQEASTVGSKDGSKKII